MTRPHPNLIAGAPPAAKKAAAEAFIDHVLVEFRDVAFALFRVQALFSDYGLKCEAVDDLVCNLDVDLGDLVACWRGQVTVERRTTL